MKKLFLALLSLLLLSLLVACGSSTVSDDGAHTHSYGEWMVTVEPTCTAYGTQVRSCSCGREDTQKIAMRAHAYGDWSETKAPTCDEKGSKTRSCACGKVDTQDIAPTGEHAYGIWSVTLAPTCGVSGSQVRSCALCGGDDVAEIPPTGDHTYGDWQVTTPATCSASGSQKRLCACGAAETQPLSTVPHDPLLHEEDAATCQRTGTAAYYECTACHKYFSDLACQNRITDLSVLTLSITTHVYVRGVCYMCGKPNELYSCEGDTVYFGYYPQSEVTNASLISTLNAKAGALPTADDAKLWTSYGYYVQSSVKNYMWYIDVQNGSDCYRGVCFTSYRPYYVSGSAYERDSYQDENGYTANQVYWFKFEPIAWSILHEDDDTMLLLCDMILDSQAFQVQNGSAANNYAESTVRAFLNEIFFETAFSSLQKQIILTTAVSNNVASTGAGNNPYACADTSDKVFLLSVQEAADAAAGFNDAQYDYDTKRAKAPTEYAKAMGTYVSPNGSTAGNGRWWMRSPQSSSASYVRLADCGGPINFLNADNTAVGVVPALRIQKSQ